MTRPRFELVNLEGFVEFIRTFEHSNLRSIDVESRRYPVQLGRHTAQHRRRCQMLTSTSTAGRARRRELSVARSAYLTPGERQGVTGQACSR